MYRPLRNWYHLLRVMQCTVAYVYACVMYNTKTDHETWHYPHTIIVPWQCVVCWVICYVRFDLQYSAARIKWQRRKVRKVIATECGDAVVIAWRGYHFNSAVQNIMASNRWQLADVWSFCYLITRMLRRCFLKLKNDIICIYNLWRHCDPLYRIRADNPLSIKVWWN